MPCLSPVNQTRLIEYSSRVCPTRGHSLQLLEGPKSRMKRKDLQPNCLQRLQRITLQPCPSHWPRWSSSSLGWTVYPLSSEWFHGGSLQWSFGKSPRASLALSSWSFLAKWSPPLCHDGLVATTTCQYPRNRLLPLPLPSGLWFGLGGVSQGAEGIRSWLDVARKASNHSSARSCRAEARFTPRPQPKRSWPWWFCSYDAFSYQRVVPSTLAPRACTSLPTGSLAQTLGLPPP